MPVKYWPRRLFSVFFLETDAAEVPISAIYATAAKILALDVETLQHQILINFKRAFLHE